MSIVCVCSGVWIHGLQQWRSSFITKLPNELWQQPWMCVQHSGPNRKRHQHDSQHLSTCTRWHPQGKDTMQLLLFVDKKIDFQQKAPKASVHINVWIINCFVISDKQYWPWSWKRSLIQETILKPKDGKVTWDIVWIVVAGRQKRSTLSLLQVTLHSEIDTSWLPWRLRAEQATASSVYTNNVFNARVHV